MIPETYDYSTLQVHTMFPRVEWWMMQKDNREIVSDEFLKSVKMELKNVKALLKTMFDVHWEARLYSLRFQLLEIVVPDQRWFESVELLNIYAIELLNHHIEFAYELI